MTPPLAKYSLGIHLNSSTIMADCAKILAQTSLISVTWSEI
jgi:hypothetical protein